MRFGSLSELELKLKERKSSVEHLQHYNKDFNV